MPVLLGVSGLELDVLRVVQEEGPVRLSDDIRSRLPHLGEYVLIDQIFLTDDCNPAFKPRFRILLNKSTHITPRKKDHDHIRVRFNLSEKWFEREKPCCVPPLMVW